MSVVILSVEDEAKLIEKFKCGSSGASLAKKYGTGAVTFLKINQTKIATLYWNSCLILIAEKAGKTHVVFTHKKGV